MDDNDLSIKHLLDTAMTLSMASMFSQAMSDIYKANIRAIELTYSQQPPRFIYAIINGKQQGPFSMGEILERINTGEITPETYIWKAGLSEWKKAKDVEDIRPNLGQLPPPVPQS